MDKRQYEKTSLLKIVTKEKSLRIKVRRISYKIFFLLLGPVAKDLHFLENMINKYILYVHDDKFWVYQKHVMRNGLIDGVV